MKMLCANGISKRCRHPGLFIYYIIALDLITKDKMSEIVQNCKMTAVHQTKCGPLGHSGLCSWSQPWSKLKGNRIHREPGVSVYLPTKQRISEQFRDVCQWTELHKLSSQPRKGGWRKGGLAFAPGHAPLSQLPEKIHSYSIWEPLCYI